MPPPPYTVTDNPESWFEHFDLVFIDPPHTGYSITAERGRAQEDAVGRRRRRRRWPRCMRARGSAGTSRWSSPIYVAGESYGTTRGAALADRLQEHRASRCRDSILVSCAMDLQSIVFAPRNDLPYALFLPAFACVAQYHGKLTGHAGRNRRRPRARPPKPSSPTSISPRCTRARACQTQARTPRRQAASPS